MNSNQPWRRRLRHSHPPATQDPIPAKRAEAITIFDAQTSELISRIRPAAETIECAFHPFQPLLVAAFENHLLRRLRREVG
jgi:hypothetical protein